MAINPNGLVIYRGPSMLDGAPIVVIATGFDKASSNVKTGGQIQTWILREDMSPQAAIDAGLDSSICGACPHRGVVVGGKNEGRSCYVTIFQAPRNVWESYHRGIYAHAPVDALPEIFAGLIVRIGSYGDGAAVPFAIWRAVMTRATAKTGYTHQWRVAPELKAYCMASCDSVADFEAATAQGWRAFRVKTADEPLLAREIICPASKEAGAKTTCEMCRACGGLSAKARVNIAINAHGAAGKINAFNARAAA